jgi:hypothetical protein
MTKASTCNTTAKFSGDSIFTFEWLTSPMTRTTFLGEETMSIRQFRANQQKIWSKPYTSLIRYIFHALTR